ncbi:MAG: zinc-dependent alcohol dehydrogenase [Thermoguttaceae bacterium]
MRALRFTGPGQVVAIDDAPMPQAKEGEVLVQCKYIALCGTNMGPYLGDGRWAKLVSVSPPGWLGHENIGQIVESHAEGWKVGQWVLAHPEEYNGFAEFVVAIPEGLARLPDNAPDYGALVVAQPLATVLRALTRTGPVINQRVAVVGQGPMGLIFTHLMGRMGARQVIAIDKVGWRLPWARRFGATDLIDSSKEDVIARVKELTEGHLVDLCIEAVGHPDALAMAAHLPRRQGRLYVFGVPHHETQQFPWFHTVVNETEIVTSMGPECKEYFQNAVDMILHGDVDLAAMVQPRMAWQHAPQAFCMYANPADAEGSLKLTLVL